MSATSDALSTAISFLSLLVACGAFGVSMQTSRKTERKDFEHQKEMLILQITQNDQFSRSRKLRTSLILDQLLDVSSDKTAALNAELSGVITNLRALMEVDDFQPKNRTYSGESIAALPYTKSNEEFVRRKHTEEQRQGFVLRAEANNLPIEEAQRLLGKINPSEIK